MHSPFPGMDPYLEAPDIWPDFHSAFSVRMSGELNHTLPASYYSRVSSWPENSDDGEPIRHHFVEVRDSSRGHKLVTLIEILSPSNKRPGPDRDSYRAKQDEVLASDASLIEIDLLRAGEHVLPDVNLSAFVFPIEPKPDYLVLVSRSWKRGAGGVGYEVFPCGLREWLPCLPVPLKQDEAPVPLDLQFVTNRAYAGGPYLRGAVDYTQPPDSPLPPEDAAWAEELLRAESMSRGPAESSA